MHKSPRKVVMSDMKGDLCPVWIRYYCDGCGAMVSTGQHMWSLARGHKT